MPYTVTIYVAAPGTPLLKDGGTSATGHVYYTISDGQSELKSFGFAPFEHGVALGPGHRVENDLQNYSKPLYARTMEISPEQYKKLNEFGEKPDAHEHGFNMYYNGVRNNCIDFTWAALNHAGLHNRVFGFVEQKQYEGSLKPFGNIDDIGSIRAPYRDSPLNREERNPMPNRNFGQWFISEGEPTQPLQAANTPVLSETDRLFASIMSAHLSGDDAALKQAQVAAFNSDLAQNTYSEVRQQNLMAEAQLAEQQRQIELERQQTIAMQAPVKTMSM